MLSSGPVSFEESEKALREGVLAAPTRRDVLVIEGPEAAGYLQGQISQDAEGLEEGTSAWTLLLEPNGRVTAWGRLSRIGAEAFWFDTDAGAGSATLERLERFKLRTKATFTLHERVPTVAVRGPKTPPASDLHAAVADALADESAGSDLGRVVATQLDWPASMGVDMLGLDLETPAVAQAFAATGVVVGDAAIVDLERVESGRPAMGREFGEKTIPAETGVVSRSVDFTKGCYVGQELVARIDSRGNNTPRSVNPVRLAAGHVPQVGDELVLDGEPVGLITSVAVATEHVAALASIKRGVEVPVELTVAVDGTPVTASVQRSHWT